MQISLSLHDNTQHNVTISKKINSGKFNVYHAKFSRKEIECAVKVFPKNSMAKKKFIQERQTLSKLRHANIISFIPVQDHSLDCDILVTEYAPYGDFFNLAIKGIFNNEKLIRTYFHQLIDAVEYTHSMGIAHLDLKLGNCLLDKSFQLKLADFDQAQTNRDKELTSKGTENYRAPEIFTREYKSFFPMDIYAIGIMLFALKTGEFPFLEEGADKEKTDASRYHYLFYNDNQAFWKIKNQKRARNDAFQPGFIELINGMLKKNPEERITLADIKQSEWFNNTTYDNKSLKIEMERRFERTFTNYTKMKSSLPSA